MPSNPPAAHEDLTIEETLKTMRVGGEHRPGAQCFQDDSGGQHWIDDGAVREFIQQHGSEHPSNFLANHGKRWDEAFFC